MIPFLLGYMRQSDEPQNLQYIRNQTHEMCLNAVSYDGLLLQYVQNQTTDICLAAIQQNPDALSHVHTQTAPLCLAAVQRDGLVLRYVKYQTPEICLAAVRQDGYALAYVRQQTKEICLAAVKRNEGARDWVKEEFKYFFFQTLKEPETVVSLSSIHDRLASQELVDPLTFSEPVQGELFGFFEKEGMLYPIGSFASVKELVEKGYKGSSLESVFCPFQNCKVDVSEIVWASSKL